MDTFQNRHALFRGSSTVSDKLDLFQSLLDSKDLTADQALALLNVIRPDTVSLLRSADPLKALEYRNPETSVRVQGDDPDLAAAVAEADSAARLPRRPTLRSSSRAPAPRSRARASRPRASSAPEQASSFARSSASPSSGSGRRA